MWGLTFYPFVESLVWEHHVPKKGMGLGQKDFASVYDFFLFDDSVVLFVFHLLLF
jgi:hypothetical protein